jgi:hypothetical protein
MRGRLKLDQQSCGDGQIKGKTVVTLKTIHPDMQRYAS